MLVDLKLSDLILMANLLEEDAIEYEELARDPNRGSSALRRAKDRRETKLLITKVIDEDQRKKEIELGLV